MNKGIVLSVVCVAALASCAGAAQQAAREIPLDVLKDKIV